MQKNMAHDLISFFFSATLRLTRSEQISLPYHAKNKSSLELFSGLILLEKKAVFHINGLHERIRCNYVKKYIKYLESRIKICSCVFMTFCFRIHTSEILSWFDSLFSLCLFCEQMVSSHPHNPGHSLYICVCHMMAAA